MTPAIAAELTAHAYGAARCRRECASRLGFSEIIPFERRGTFAYVALQDRTAAAVIFRGTAKRWHWRQNFKAGKVDDELGRVHEGFRSELDHVWRQLSRQLDEIQTMGIRIVEFAGHSKGAAEAVIAASRRAQQALTLLHESRCPEAVQIMPNALFTFGCPRVGDRVFAARLAWALEGRWFRYVSGNDLVPGWPPRWLNYSHGVRETYLDCDGRQIESPYPWTRWADGIRSRLKDYRAKSRDDDGRRHYLRGLAAAIGDDVLDHDHRSGHRRREAPGAAKRFLVDRPDNGRFIGGLAADAPKGGNQNPTDTCET